MTAQESDRRPYVHSIVELTKPYRRYYDSRPIPGFVTLRMKMMAMRDINNISDLVNTVVRYTPATPGKLTFVAAAIINGNGIAAHDDSYAQKLHAKFSAIANPLNARQLFDTANERDILAMESLLARDRLSREYGNGRFLTSHQRDTIKEDLARRYTLQVKLGLRAQEGSSGERK